MEKSGVLNLASQSTSSHSRVLIVLLLGDGLVPVSSGRMCACNPLLVHTNRMRQAAVTSVPSLLHRSIAGQ